MEKAARIIEIFISSTARAYRDLIALVYWLITQLEKLLAATRSRREKILLLSRHFSPRHCHKHWTESSAFRHKVKFLYFSGLSFFIVALLVERGWSGTFNGTAVAREMFANFPRCFSVFVVFPSKTFLLYIPQKFFLRLRRSCWVTARERDRDSGEGEWERAMECIDELSSLPNRAREARSSLNLH